MLLIADSHVLGPLRRHWIDILWSDWGIIKVCACVRSCVRACVRLCLFVPCCMIVQLMWCARARIHACVHACMREHTHTNAFAR